VIYADYSKQNPDSGRVLQKTGMHYADYFSKNPEDDFSQDTIRYRPLKSEFIEK